MPQNQELWALKTLQEEKMCAIRRKTLADLTVQTLEYMRNEQDFSLVFKKIKVSASEIEATSPLALPRKRRKPKCSILHYVTGNTEATGAAHYPENLYEH